MAEGKAGRYQLLEELGRGAMGVVYKAFDPMIGRTVAVKTMRLAELGTGLPRPDLVQRFQTEARAAGQLVHPNIVIVYDAGEDQGLYYITMEYVEGRSLQTLLDRKQPFPLPRVMRIMGQVCSALDFAHQRHVVHRDVKPANIMLTGDDTVKVTDFGTAKILQLGTTQTGTIMGTPSYMSPEQVKGKPVDGRSDVFSVGVILYELVTGEKPFPGENVTTVIYKLVNEEPIPPRDLDSSVHPGLNDVITRALAKDPDQRYQSCRELLQDLLNYRSLGTGGRADATVVVVGRQPAQAAPAATKPEPPAERSGTLPGVPGYASSTPRPPVPTPAAESAAPGLSEEEPISAELEPTKPRPIPKPMTLPPLPYTPGSIAAEPEEGKRSHLWLLIVLLIMLGAGTWLIWPTLRDAYFPAKEKIASTQPAAPAAPKASPLSGGPQSAVETPAPKREEAKPVEPGPAEVKPAAKAAPAKEPAKKGAEMSKAPPPGNAAAPAEKEPARPELSRLKTRIDERLAQIGLAGKVNSEIAGDRVRLTGEVSPGEFRRLRQQLRLSRTDRVEFAVTEAAAGEEASPRVRGSEIEVFTDVNGARALVRGPKSFQDACKTPCRFEDLTMGRYELEVTLDGYRTERRIVQVGKGTKQVSISLQPAMARLRIQSTPPGAEIYIDGNKRPEVTPTTVVVAPGTRRVRVQRPGYTPYEETVRVEADSVQQLNVELPVAAATTGQSPTRLSAGWIDVRTIPRGADILIDGKNIGRKTPDRIELPAGTYTLVLYLPGYQAVRETITIGANQTVQINKTLPQQ
jgi:serine/threonine protein kinase